MQAVSGVGEVCNVIPPTVSGSTVQHGGDCDHSRELDISESGSRLTMGVCEERAGLGVSEERDAFTCRCGKTCKAVQKFQWRHQKCQTCYDRFISTYIACKGVASETGERLYERDVSRLEKGQMMNDKLLQHVLLRKFKGELTENDMEHMHLFDTLLVERLLNDYPDASHPTYFPFNKRVLFFPIFYDEHFSLVVYFQTSLNPYRATGYFLHLDSCVGYHHTETITYKLEKYVKKCYRSRQVEFLNFIVLDISQQTNVYDCGYFVCMYFEKILRHCHNSSWLEGCVVPYNDLLGFRAPKATTAALYDQFSYKCLGDDDILLLRHRVALDIWKSDPEMFSYKIHICEKNIADVEKRIERIKMEHEKHVAYTTP
mgnify:CR=1 FL=1